VKIAFFGLPLAAVLMARDGHEIVYAAVSMPGPGLRRLTARIGQGRVQLKPDLAAEAAQARVRANGPDLIVSWFWTTKLPPALLGIAPAIGFHPSLLPRHRGPDPYFWALDCGDEVTGVTAHVLDAEYDTGAILGRREVRIDPAWNAWELARALDRPSLALLREIVRAYADGKPPTPRPQDARGATQAPIPAPDDLAIRWSWSAERVERRVRAAGPWPGAWTAIGAQIVTLVRVRPTTDFPKALEAGEAAIRKDGVAVVRAGTDALELLEGRTEEDTRLGPDEFSALVVQARP
jgi:methionyl-tRNA formyltransferase